MKEEEKRKKKKKEITQPTETSKRRRRKKKKRTQPIETSERRRKKKKEKERKNPANGDNGEERKKWSKVTIDPDNGSLHVYLITKISLKIELWKLKTAKICFPFP